MEAEKKKVKKEKTVSQWILEIKDKSAKKKEIDNIMEQVF